MAVSTPSLFPTLGVAPVLGRVPIPEDEDRVALLSHGLWMSWFGGDTAVIGRSYYIGGEQRTVIGVMGPEFRFPRGRGHPLDHRRHPSGGHRAGPVRDGAGRADAPRRDDSRRWSGSWARWRSACPSDSAGRRATPS